MRYERTRLIDELNRAIKVTDIVIDTTPIDYPDRASRLSNLIGLLSRLFERTRSTNDLNRAVKVTDIVVGVA